MPSHPPLVSIITPTHNSADTLTRTLDSVVGQSFESWEHIIVDDASTDTTKNILQAHCAQNPRAQWIGLDSNQGAAVARNTAIEAAEGRYIAFLDSDDVWLPEKLEKQLQFMQSHDIAFSFSGYEKVDENDAILGTVHVPKRQTYSDLLKNNTVGCLTAMYDREKLGKVYMPLIRKRQDLGLWLRLLKATPYAYGMPDVLAQYRIRRNSISSNKSNAAKYTWRLYRNVEGLSLIKASYYFAHYALNGVLKTYLSKSSGKEQQHG